MTGPGAGRRPSGRLAVLLAAGAVPLVLLPGLVAPPAAAAESCVGVVIDARLLGGGVSTGCAKGDPDTGLDALAAAGFRYAFAPRLPGFVCQIDVAPECSRTGPTTYWSYWYRTKDSAPWVYSSAGAGSHDPAPGSTEAWVWQDGGRREPPDVSLQAICPQVARAGVRTEQSPAAPAPPAPSASAPSPKVSRSPSAVRSSSPSGRTPSTVPTTDAPESAAATTPSTAAAGVAARNGSEPTPWTGVVLGGGLVAALGAAALARARRSGGSR